MASTYNNAKTWRIRATQRANHCLLRKKRVLPEVNQGLRQELLVSRANAARLGGYELCADGKASPIFQILRNHMSVGQEERAGW